MKWEWNSIQKEEQFVFIPWGSKGKSPLQVFTARVPQVIAQTLVSSHTEVLLSTPPQLTGKSQHYAFCRLFVH